MDYSELFLDHLAHLDSFSLGVGFFLAAFHFTITQGLDILFDFLHDKRNKKEH